MLKNKVAIVTGGTRGIGIATVRTFLENGARVILLGSKEESAMKAVNLLKEENAKWDVEGDYPDLLDPKALEDFVLKVKDLYGRIDILVNNAGVSDATPIDNYTGETFKNVLDLNVNGIMNMIIPVVKVMKEQGSGVILSTSSMVSFSGQPSGIAYPTSKAAVNGLTWSLARELGPAGIRVNAVAPGITNTDMVSSLPKEVIEPMIQMIPARRVGEPEDIANAFLFLASDLASYITGVTLSVDGAMRV